jgi:hypothetical protein
MDGGFWTIFQPFCRIVTLWRNRKAVQFREKCVKRQGENEPLKKRKSPRWEGFEDAPGAEPSGQKSLL